MVSATPINDSISIGMLSSVPRGSDLKMCQRGEGEKGRFLGEVKLLRRRIQFFSLGVKLQIRTAAN